MRCSDCHFCSLFSGSEEDVLARTQGDVLDAKLLKLDPGLVKVLEELCLILCVLFDVGFHLGILDEREVRGEHHEFPTGIFVLERSLPLFDSPLFFEEQPEVLGREGSGGPGPRSAPARSIRVAPAEHACAPLRHTISLSLKPMR